MRPVILCAAVFSFVTNVSAQPTRDEFHQTPMTKVMVVGTHHFHQTDAPDVLAEKHQQDIEAIVDELAEFQPTIIGLECVAAQEAGLNEKYAAWLRGEHRLSKNERQQIGFRLARNLGHEQIHCVDAEHPPAPNFDVFDGWDDFFAYAKERGEYGSFERWIPALERYGAELQDFMKSASMKEIMDFHNTTDADQSPPRLLMIEVTVGVDDSWAGADWLGRFEGRNIRIFAKTQKLAAADDRVLLLFGNGHKRPLEKLFNDSYEFEVVPTPLFSEAFKSKEFP